MTGSFECPEVERGAPAVPLPRRPGSRALAGTTPGLDAQLRAIFARSSVTDSSRHRCPPARREASEHAFRLPEGIYRIQASSPPLAVGLDTEQRFEVVAGARRELRCEEAVVTDLRLQVLDEATGQELLGWSVMIGEGDVPPSTTIRAREGRVRMALRPGSYRLAIAAPDFEPLLQDVRIGAEPSRELTLRLSMLPTSLQGLGYRSVELARSQGK